MTTVPGRPDVAPCVEAMTDGEIGTDVGASGKGKPGRQEILRLVQPAQLPASGVPRIAPLMLHRNE